MEESRIYAKDYLENLLTFFGLNLEVEARIEEEVIQLEVPSTHLNNHLIGPNSTHLRALQSLLAAALIQQGYSCNRINLDVANYKKQRLERLAIRAAVWVQEVQDSGHPKELSPMNPAERRLVHRLATASGLTSDSTGIGRQRYVTLRPPAES